MTPQAMNVEGSQSRANTHPAPAPPLLRRLSVGNRRRRWPIVVPVRVVEVLVLVVGEGARVVLWDGSMKKWKAKLRTT